MEAVARFSTRKINVAQVEKEALVRAGESVRRAGAAKAAKAAEAKPHADKR